jgi:hypothetical protein
VGALRPPGSRDPFDTAAVERRRAEHLARPYATTDVSAARGLSAREDRAGTAYTLSNRAEVGMLISRTPQLDSNDDTLRDRSRCGAAAVVNGMLLSGSPRANADALGEVSRAHGVGEALVPGSDAALASKRDGHLTARESCVLQELAYETARRCGSAGSRPDVGLSRTELGPDLRELSAAGAFPGSSVELSNHALPGGADPHWTVSVDGPNGPASADSWPRTDGYATVLAGRELAVPGSTSMDSHVTLDRDHHVSSGPD